MRAPKSLVAFAFVGTAAIAGSAGGGEPGPAEAVAVAVERDGLEEEALIPASVETAAAAATVPPTVTDELTASVGEGDDKGEPTLEAMPFARPKWPPPSAAELDAAPSVELAHNEPMVSDFGESGACSARATRGWLSVTCKVFEGSLSLLGGSGNGVVFQATPSEVTVLMPLAPGDRRVVQLARVGGAYEGGGLVTAGVLSESWVDTEGPHVTFAHQLF